jgi:hypothetical protein
MKTKLIKAKATILLVDGLIHNDDIADLNEVIIIKPMFTDFNSIGYKLNWDILSDDEPRLELISLKDTGAEKGNWKFISTIENLSEIEADGLVERQASDIKIYLNYNKMRFKIGMKAIESFQSLLQANDENNEFNPKTTLIFIKSN